MKTIMGATGRIGGIISRELLERGETVRALGRSKSKLAPLAKLGAQTAAGNAEDARFLTEAFQGADAVFALLPYDPQETDYFGQQRRVGNAIVHAAQAGGVERIVFLSSLGADQASGTGMVVSMHEQEERLRASNHFSTLALRPGPFFENLYGQIEQVAHAGFTADAFVANLPLPMISTRDIADAAICAFMDTDWSGFTIRELLGERDISFAEASALLGERIGIPNMRYAQQSPEAMIELLTQVGFSHEIARLEVEIAVAANDGRAKSLADRNAENTTTTAFETFADQWAQAYRAASSPTACQS